MPVNWIVLRNVLSLVSVVLLAAGGFGDMFPLIIAGVVVLFISETIIADRARAQWWEERRPK